MTVAETLAKVVVEAVDDAVAGAVVFVGAAAVVGEQTLLVPAYSDKQNNIIVMKKM